MQTRQMYTRFQDAKGGSCPFVGVVTGTGQARLPNKPMPDRLSDLAGETLCRARVCSMDP